MANDTDKPTRTLTFRADIAILADQERWDQFESYIPNELPVERYQSVDTLCEELSSNVAVVLVSAQYPDDGIERIVRYTLTESEHARIALLATDGKDLLQCDVPHDKSFVLPEDHDALQSTVKHLYIRAYYCVTTDRYYKLSLAIKNNETKSDAPTEKLDRLRESRQRIESYLELFRKYLDPADFEAMKTRDHRYHELLESKATADPSSFNLPDLCPDCELDWTTWHGPRLRIGYEQIGANTWQCTRCGHIMADNDPENYKIG